MAYAFSKATFSQACRTAIDLVEDMASIPLDYLKWTTLAAVSKTALKSISCENMPRKLTTVSITRLKNYLVSVTSCGSSCVKICCWQTTKS